jgi:endonuclease YncB( thermonuclease family)
LAAVCFAAGLGAGALLAPASVNSRIAPAAPQVEPARLRAGHPADVLRVIDGDTFEARVHIWPGMQITTKVRLRGIDAAEMHARCAEERTQAVVARDALARILSEGDIGIARIVQDKYGGRVDAEVSTDKTPNVAAAMLNGGYARRYVGGRRQSWCG